MVAAYRAEAAARAVELGSETTPRFNQRTFARFVLDLENGLAYEAARKVAAEPTLGLGMYGDPGVGKSHLAAAIVNDCTTRGIVAKYIGVEEFLARVKATFDRNSGGGDTEYALIRAYATVPVLALDDFGKEALSDWNVRTIFALVNRRYERNLPLIVTSNFAPAALFARKVASGAEQMTYRSTLDRVGEMVGSWVSVTGRSRR